MAIARRRGHHGKPWVVRALAAAWCRHHRGHSGGVTHAFGRTGAASRTPWTASCPIRAVVVAAARHGGLAATSGLRCGPRTLETSRRNGVGWPQKFEPVGPHTRQQPMHVSTSARESARGQGKALPTVNHVDCYTAVITWRSRAVQWHRWAWLNREGSHRGKHVVGVVGVRPAAKTALWSAQVAESHGPDGQACVDLPVVRACHGTREWGFNRALSNCWCF